MCTELKCEGEKQKQFLNYTQIYKNLSTLVSVAKHTTKELLLLQTTADYAQKVQNV